MAAVAVWVGTATAGPLAPSLATDALGNFTDPSAVIIGGMSYIAGEGAAPNTQIGDTIDGVTIGGGAVAHVDWIVRHEGGFIYRYFYQVENTSVFDISTFTLGAPTAPPVGFIIGSGTFVPGADIDVANAATGGLAHDVVDFSNLTVGPHPPFPATNERETAGATIQDPATVIISSLIANFGVTCTAPGVPAGCGAPSLLNIGEESSIITALGTRPHYGNWLTAGVGTAGTPVSWASSADNPVVGAEDGVMIPVPRVPQPSALMLLGTGLAGSALWSLRRRNKR
jgi:hypothetical protein